jgi:hypothetical protein
VVYQKSIDNVTPILNPIGRRRTATLSGNSAWTNVSSGYRKGEGVSGIVYSKGHRGPPYKSGGPFLMKRSTLDLGSVNANGNLGGTQYEGQYVITLVPSVASIPDQATTLFGKGATGYARGNPLNSDANLAQTLGELRELPLSLIKLGKNGPPKPRKINPGDTFLGIQFGLVPLISDIKALYETQKNMGKKLAQLRRDNGKFVRRRVGLGYTESISNVLTNGIAVFPTHAAHSHSQIHDQSSSTSKYWFSGRFRFYLPELDENYWPDRLVRNLYGANVDAELLWELTPWSWLADWFANVGDVVHNLSSYASQQCIMDYGYVMGNVRNSCVRTQSFSCGSSLTYGGASPQKRYSLTGTRVNELKQRLQAYPFGFGPTSGSLTDMQKAVLGALGISRAF